MKSAENKKEQYKNFDPDLLDKFYRNECTPEERAWVEKWFLGLEHRKEINRKASEVWDRTPDTGKQKNLLEMILYRIHYRLRMQEFTEAKSKGKGIRARRIISSVAAAVIILFTGFWLGNRQSTVFAGNVYSELHAPYGSRISFNLPDGTRGWLNSGSTLKYPVRFTGRKRTVSLEGEGYFEVKHNPGKPFIVQTGNFRVIALGTAFNVQAFENEKSEEVTLVRGRVVIEKKLPDNSYRHVLIMKPDEHVQLDDRTGKIIRIDRETDKYIGWKDGRLLFRNEPLSRVIREMERFYNVDIQVDDPKLYRYHFHATFEDETLFEALRLLTISTPMRYKICKREKYPDGTFKKRKVILTTKS